MNKRYIRKHDFSKWLKVCRNTKKESFTIDNVSIVKKLRKKRLDLWSCRCATHSKCECGECINVHSLMIHNCTTFDSFLSQWFQHLSSYPTFLHGSDHSMGTRFHVYLTIPSLHEKISFQFRFWAHFFALRNPDTRLKIFPTALKKFALRAEKELIYLSAKSEDKILNFELFLDVKIWAKNMRLARKEQKKWLKKYVFIPKMRIWILQISK